MKQTIIEFIDFLKCPQQSFRSNHKVCIFIICWIIMLLLNIFALILSFIYGFFRLDFPEKVLFSYEEKYFFLSLLLVPIIEEIGYRLYLLPQKRNILLSSIAIVWMVYVMVITVPESPVEYIIIRCLVSLPIGFLVFLFLSKIIPKIKYSIYSISRHCFLVLCFSIHLFMTTSVSSLFYMSC